MGKIEKNEIYYIEPDFFENAKVEVFDEGLKWINHIE